MTHKLIKFKNMITKIDYKCINYTKVRIGEFFGDLLYTLIFLIKSEGLKRYFFSLYVSKVKTNDKKTNTVEVSAEVNSNFRVSVDHNVAEYLEIPQNSKIFDVQKKPKLKWYNPTQYPPKAGQAIIDYGTPKKENYNKKLHLNYCLTDVGSSKQVIPQDLSYDMAITREPHESVKVYMDSYIRHKKSVKADTHKFLSNLKSLKTKDYNAYKSKIKNMYYSKLKNTNNELYNYKVKKGLYNPAENEFPNFKKGSVFSKKEIKAFYIDTIKQKQNVTCRPKTN